MTRDCTKSHYEQLSPDLCFLIILTHGHRSNPEPNKNPDLNPYSNLTITRTWTKMEMIDFSRQAVP